jgi:hypothetical protein
LKAPPPHPCDDVKDNKSLGVKVWVAYNKRSAIRYERE